MELFDLSGRKIAALISDRMLCVGTHEFLVPEYGLRQGMGVIAATINGSTRVTKAIAPR